MASAPKSVCCATGPTSAAPPTTTTTTYKLINCAFHAKDNVATDTKFNKMMQRCYDGGNGGMVVKWHADNGQKAADVGCGADAAIVEHKCMRTSILYEHNTENIFMLISHMLREATEASKNQHSTSDHILKNCLKRNSVLADNNKYR